MPRPRLSNAAAKRRQCSASHIAVLDRVESRGHDGRWPFLQSNYLHNMFVHDLLPHAAAGAAAGAGASDPESGIFRGGGDVEKLLKWIRAHGGEVS